MQTNEYMCKYQWVDCIIWYHIPFLFLLVILFDLLTLSTRWIQQIYFCISGPQTTENIVSGSIYLCIAKLT